MSGVKKRINFTGRKRIRHELVDIRLLETKLGESLKAQASLQLEGEGFPGEALVSLEAYHRSSGMRFDCGTVANLSIPPVLDLTEVDRSGTVLFRVKVIDSKDSVGRLLGSAERIQPCSEEGDEGRRSIFPIKTRDLGAEVWKVEVDHETPPALILNNRIPGLVQQVLEQPLLQGVLLPAALRIVLTELVREPYADDEDATEWKSDWLGYCTDQLGVPDPSELPTDTESRSDWVDEAVRHFCEDLDFVRRIRSKTEVEL
jgi:hypothetical protein